VGISPVDRAANVAERVNDSYSSSVAFGLTGCRLAQIVFNAGTTLNLPLMPA
jgi:cell division protein FtsW (lipid II flippase)